MSISTPQNSSSTATYFPSKKDEQDMGDYWKSKDERVSDVLLWTPKHQVRRTRHAGHCWRSRDELISDVLLRTPTYGRAKAG